MSQCWSKPKGIVYETLAVGQYVWSDNDICKLVLSYKRNACLWRRNDPFYLAGERKRQAYERILRDMKTCLNPKPNEVLTLVEIMMKLREVRRSYVAELKSVLLSESTCRRYEPTAKWFHELHDFLYPNLDYDETAELHQSIANRLVTTRNRGSSANNITTVCRARERPDCQTALRYHGRFQDQLIGCESAGDWKRQYNSFKGEPCSRSQVLHRTRLESLSSCESNSTDHYTSSCSDIDADGSSSSTVCKNGLSCNRERTSDTDVSSGSGSTYNPPNGSIREARRSLGNRTREWSLRQAENEFFTGRVACRMRNIGACYNCRLRARADIRKIR